jgi:hypothetical protein
MRRPLRDTDVEDLAGCDMIVSFTDSRASKNRGRYCFPGSVLLELELTGISICFSRQRLCFRSPWKTTYFLLLLLSSETLDGVSQNSIMA